MKVHTRLLTAFLLVRLANAGGVAIIDAVNAVYLPIQTSEVSVEVESQVAVVRTTQSYHNPFDDPQEIKYGFPMPGEASATGLRWRLDGAWHEAVFEPAPQDTTLPGEGEIDSNLRVFLGEWPLYFDMEDPLQPDSNLVIELSYVELLPYSFGNVNFRYPNDMHLVQQMPLDLQSFQLQLHSQRSIEDIVMLSGQDADLSNDGHFAQALWQDFEIPAEEDYELQYSLDLDELGLFGLSTMIADSLLPDEHGGGFFVFIAEPDPSQEIEVMDKVFTLIVDRSGSMSGQKIVQARNASSFVVEHLNEGDRFNIVDFSTYVQCFRDEHVDYNAQTEAEALAYISGFQANGSTNISGAFELAIPQFAAADDSTANIIVFFTDGLPTAGITDTEGILNLVNNLVDQNETLLSIFTFGIGADVNRQLLTLLAIRNNGLAEFLDDEELEECITNFYLRIRNPVLLNTTLSFVPDVVTECYPQPLPSLYVGEQMIVTGRYAQAAEVTVNLAGEAFGQPVEYSYPLALADTANTDYQFLTKVWAKTKIEHLLVLYYALDPESDEARALRDEIIALSLAWGVISPFTSFGDDPEISIGEDEWATERPAAFALLGNYPNPFNPRTAIRIMVAHALDRPLVVKIYNLQGQLVRVLVLDVTRAGIHELTWDEAISGGRPAPSGVYIYTVDFGEAVLAGRMVLLR